MMMKDFILKYEHLLGHGVWEVARRDETDPGQLLSALKQYVSRADCPRIYLMIDEYDNFTNTILSTGEQNNYRGTTHGDGFIRSFFNVVKAATSNVDAAVDRTKGNTRLGLITLVFKGWELVALEKLSNAYF